MPLPELEFQEFAARYCERQEQTPTGLQEILKRQYQNYDPDGWMLLECHMLGSSYLGQFTALPYGPNNTYKAVASNPLSPRGLASDMSVVVAILPVGNFLSSLFA